MRDYIVDRVALLHAYLVEHPRKHLVHHIKGYMWVFAIVRLELEKVRESLR